MKIVHNVKSLLYTFYVIKDIMVLKALPENEPADPILLIVTSRPTGHTASHIRSVDK